MPKYCICLSPVNVDSVEFFVKAKNIKHAKRKAQEAVSKDSDYCDMQVADVYR